ncbi:O-antigen ligase family protein [Halopseudomonas sabulinigri]|uniref:O-antigen ligase family protein n=1 Tax=Halopseudomonas sabulinigri TaxID=472181 RepID=UPI00333FAB09
MHSDSDLVSHREHELLATPVIYAFLWQLPLILWICFAQWLLYGYSLVSYCVFFIVFLFGVIGANDLSSKQFRLLGAFFVALFFGLTQWLSFLEQVPIISSYRIFHFIAGITAFWLAKGGAKDFFLLRGTMLCRLAFVTAIFAIGLVNGQTMVAAEWSVFMLEIFCFALATMCIEEKSRSLVVYAGLAIALALLMSYSNHLALAQVSALGSWQRVFSMCGHMAFVAAIYLWVRSDSRAIPLILSAVACCTVFYFVCMAVFWISLDNPVSYSWFSAPPLFQHIRHQGYLLCGLAVGSVFMFLQRGRLAPICLAVVFLVFALLFWNGGRGAILGALVGIALLSGSFPLRKNVRSWKWLCIVALSALCASAIFRVEQRGVGWLNALFRSDTDTVNGLSSGRLSIWLRLLEPIQERLWFGWGGDGFRSVWTGSSRIIQAHNGLMQSLLEWGLLTTVLFGLMMSAIYVLGLKAFLDRCLKTPDALFLGMAIASAYLVLAVFDGVFYYATPGAYLAMGFGLVWAGRAAARPAAFG